MTQMRHKSEIKPWYFVPSLYFMEGIPYSVVMILALIMYKRLGISNSVIAFWTSVLNLPWVLKPLWSPLVDIYWTKRKWVWWMQAALGITFGLLAAGLHLPVFFTASICILSSVAVLSATHDIAADGFYIHALNSHDQALFSGIRNTFYRLSMILCQGVLVIAAGYMETHSGLGMQSIHIQVNAPEHVQQSFTANNNSEQAIIIKAPEGYNVKTGEDVDFLVSLRQPPPKEAELRIGRVEGSKLLETDTTHLSFDKTNWNVPRRITITAAADAATNSEAVFRVDGGNITLSWSIVFAVLSLLTLFAAFYHSRVLPRPTSDRAEKNSLWGFIKAACVLIIAMGLPLIILKTLFTTTASCIDAIVPNATSRTALLNLIISIMKIALPVALITILFKINAIRNATSSYFKRMSLAAALSFDDVFMSFFRKKQIGTLLAFLLLYRLGEAQLTKLAAPFLLDAQEKGGLALETTQLGFIYGGIGLAALLSGGIFGGYIVSRFGLKKCFYLMWAAINVPDLCYLYLAFVQPTSSALVSACVAIEQFGYGIGFTGYMIYMLYIAGTGKWKVAHYAICTGFMALGMMIPGMISGYIQELLGYKTFFVWVMLCTLPALWVIYRLPLDPDFGTKKMSDHQ